MSSLPATTLLREPLWHLYRYWFWGWLFLDVNQIEQALLKDALAKADGVQTRAAQLLGINFRSFQYRARKYGLDRQIRDRDHGTV